MWMEPVIFRKKNYFTSSDMHNFRISITFSSKSFNGDEHRIPFDILLQFGAPKEVLSLKKGVWKSNSQNQSLVDISEFAWNL